MIRDTRDAVFRFLEFDALAEIRSFVRERSAQNLDCAITLRFETAKPKIMAQRILGDECLIGLAIPNDRFARSVQNLGERSGFFIVQRHARWCMSKKLMSDSPEAGGCGCHADEKRAAGDPAYRRALWIVVLLNLGFGVVDIVGGFLARSQALKADALDFLGDGSITLVGLLALAWMERTRVRVALTQGCFLALLGLGVIGAAIWRSLNAVAPEADVMGGLGVAGLVVNVTAALALVRFREGGDANARAIWLFSRNDARW